MRSYNIVITTFLILIFITSMNICIINIGKDENTILKQQYFNESNETYTRALADSGWPCYGGDVRNTFQSPYNTENNGRTLTWKFKVDPTRISKLVYDNEGTIYVGSWDRYIYAIYPNGTLKWKYKLKMHMGSSPLVGSNGTVYVVCDLNSECIVLGPDGVLKKKLVIPCCGDTSPTMNDEGILYLAGGDSVFAIDTENDFIQKWQYKTEKGFGSSSPAIGPNGVIYIGCSDNHLYAINPNGTLKWKYKTKGPIIHTSPAVDSNGTIYVSPSDSFLYSINPNGTLKWKYKAGGDSKSSPAITSDGTIYFTANDKYLYSLWPNGSLRWKYYTGYGCITPVISSEGSVYLGTVCISPNGNFKWKFEIEGKIGYHPIIGKDGTIYCVFNDGYICAINKGAPSPPQSLIPREKDNKIILSWNKPWNNGGYPINKYNIYRADECQVECLIDTVESPQTTYIDSTVQSGMRYKYSVTACNFFGESEPSNFVDCFLFNEGITIPPLVSVSQSDKEWPRILHYNLSTVLYQNEILEFFFLESYDVYTNINLTVVNGTFVHDNDDYYEYMNYDYYQYMGGNVDGSSYISPNKKYHLIPNQLDINFELVLNVSIWRNEEEIYSEEHTFWIVGEPEIIPGVDLNEDVNLSEIYLKALWVSILIIGPLFGVIYLIRRRGVKK